MKLGLVLAVNELPIVDPAQAMQRHISKRCKLCQMRYKNYSTQNKLIILVDVVSAIDKLGMLS